MTKADIIKNSIFGLLAVSILVLAISLFTKKKDDSSYKELIKAKDETIAEIKKGREGYENLYQNNRQDIETLQSRYESLIENINKSQQVYQKLENTLKNIPANIARISNDDDAIRDAFARFQ